MVQDACGTGARACETFVGLAPLNLSGPPHPNAWQASRYKPDSSKRDFTKQPGWNEGNTFRPAPDEVNKMKSWAKHEDAGDLRR